MRRDSLRVPTYVGALPDFEIATLRVYLDRACALQRIVEGIDVTVAAAIGTLLITGRSLDVITELSASTISSKSSIFAAAPGLVIMGGHWGWWLPAGAIENEQTLRDGEARHNHATTGMLWLPCGKLMQKLLTRMLEERGIAIQHNGCRPLFTRQPDDLERQVREALSSIRKLKRSNLTLGRSVRWLYDAVFAQASHDHAVTALITGRKSPFDRAGGSYANLPLNGAARLYVQAISAIESGIDEWIPPELESLSVGSPYRPLEEKLTRFACAQLEILRSRGRGKRIDIVEFHDAMTRYTAVMVALAIGVRHPGALPRVKDIDRATGFAAIEDKRGNRPDLPSGYRRRLVWVCDEAQDQIRFYEAHLDAVRDRLGLAAKKGDLLTSGSLPFFTLTSGRGTQLVPRRLPAAGLLKELAYNGLRVRPNAWRHFLRSRLVGECPGEVIRAYMGHWEHGLEPWAGDSALDPFTYRRCLSGTIPGLFRSLRFEPTTGLIP